jgi:hypothetical protein
MMRPDPHTQVFGAAIGIPDRDFESIKRVDGSVSQRSPFARMFFVP